MHKLKYKYPVMLNLYNLYNLHFPGTPSTDFVSLIFIILGICCCSSDHMGLGRAGDMVLNSVEMLTLIGL